MEMSPLSWLALLTIYMLYILLGGCMFESIECQKELRDHEAEESREIKLIIVDLLAQVLLDDDDGSKSNFTSVIRRIRKLSSSNPNLNRGNPTAKVFQDHDGNCFKALRLLWEMNCFRTLGTEGLHCRHSWDEESA